MYVKEDILLLKSFLGHSSLASTQIYTHIHDKQIKEAFESNPLSNFCIKKERGE
jgi:site-specific recombinase XerD